MVSDILNKISMRSTNRQTIKESDCLTVARRLIALFGGIVQDAIERILRSEQLKHFKTQLLKHLPKTPPR